MNNSDFIAKYLTDKGYDTAFGVTGGGAMFLNESFRKQKKLKFIFTHHEQAAAMAAEAYYRIKKKTSNIISNIWSWRHECNNRCNRIMGRFCSNGNNFRTSRDKRSDWKV